MSIPCRAPNGSSKLLTQAADVFGGDEGSIRDAQRRPETPDLKTLHAKFGQLALEHDC
jgi:hypothetical protein